MKTIKNKVYTNTIEIKHSKFITTIGYIENKEQLNQFLQTYKKTDATHNCYAYKYGIDNVQGGYNDDHEPQGSAGLPIFRVIENNDLTNIVILVVRYYGGINLGLGPLTRAYSQSAREILTLTKISQLKKYWITKINFPITNIKKVDQFCLKNDFFIVDKAFEANVEYTIRSVEKVTKNSLFTIVEAKQTYL